MVVVNTYNGLGLCCLNNIFMPIYKSMQSFLRWLRRGFKRKRNTQNSSTRAATNNVKQLAENDALPPAVNSHNAFPKPNAATNSSVANLNSNFVSANHERTQNFHPAAAVMPLPTHLPRKSDIDDDNINEITSELTGSSVTQKQVIASLYNNYKHVRLSSGNPDLAVDGTPSADAKVWTAEDVAHHNSNKSAWIVIDGCVYDVTDYLDDHPGGDYQLLERAGKPTDFGKDFEEAGHSKLARGLMVDYYIGILQNGAKNMHRPD